jgi:large subunit ribosomal protein L29
MKIGDIRNLSDQELQVELDRLHRHLFDLRSQSVTEKLEDPTQVTKTRRDIARILTVQNQRRTVASQNQERK